MWYFGVFVCFCIVHLQNSQRVNIPLGRKGTSLSTLFRLSKGLWQPGTIPREIFPAGGELSLQPAQSLCAEIFFFSVPSLVSPPSGILFWFLQPPSKMVGAFCLSSLQNTEQFALCIFSSLIICPIYQARVSGKNWSNDPGNPAVPTTELYVTGL